MLAYGLLALVLSTVLAIVTWGVVSDYLNNQRDSSAVTITSDNAAALRYGLFGVPQPCNPARVRGECESPEAPKGVHPMDLMNSLPSTDAAASMLYFEQHWYALTG